eukprot:m.162955 g.162955  ORF g.162955 m.162955 type:complete len:208 (+) comp12250_c0_seq1:2087-2710(+)
MHSPQLTPQAAILLRQCLHNIQKAPSNLQHRRIHTVSKRFTPVWSLPPARLILEASGWIPDPEDHHYIVLPLDVDPACMELLINEAASPTMHAGGDVASSPPCRANTEKHTEKIRDDERAADRDGATSNEDDEEKEREEAAIAKRRAHEAERMRRIKAERDRVRKQIEADRRQEATSKRHQRTPSLSCGFRPGANMNRFADLNQGGR